MRKWDVIIKVRTASGDTNDQILYINYPNDNQWTSYSPYIGFGNQGKWEWQRYEFFPSMAWSTWKLCFVVYENVSGTKNELLILDGFDPELRAEGGTVTVGGKGLFLFTPIPVADDNFDWQTTDLGDSAS